MKITRYNGFYFKCRQYYATDGSDKISFNIKLNTIQNISGFQRNLETQIIGEELGYNKVKIISKHLIS